MHAHVVHVGIGGEPDTLQTPAGLREHERAIARDLVPHLIVPQLLRRQALTVLTHDDDIAARFHARLPCVVRPLLPREHGVSLAGARIERQLHDAKLDSSILVEEEGGISLQLGVQYAAIGEERADAEHELVGGVGHRRPRDRWWGGAVAPAGNRESQQPHYCPRPHTTPARMRSCRWTIPTRRASSSTTGIAITL